MGFRDILRKKDGGADSDDRVPRGGGAATAAKTTTHRVDGADFTFVRTDTSTREVIRPPDDDGGGGITAQGLGGGGGGDGITTQGLGGGGGGDGQNLLSPTSPTAARSPRRSLDVLFRSGGGRSGSVSSQASHSSRRRLSDRLHLSRSPECSEYVPADLPEITTTSAAEEPGVEVEWEKRATMLAGRNLARSPGLGEGASLGELNGGRARSGSAVSSKAIDEDIQEAIRLHEGGELAASTRLFGRLADPGGPNNPLSQVLYGLALRHGWGCEPDPANAVKFLTAAASNSAAVEQLALQAGMTKGGAAKGELVMAIYELANCFRHGWGIEQDAFAARQYYETAANLGDGDAMNDAAWCYEHGFGGKKDKFTAAQYYRLAEKAGNRTMGNSWIWKDKYDPGGQAKKR